MSTDAVRSGRNPLTHHLLVKQVGDIAWLSGLFVVAVAIVTSVVAIFSTIETSAWEIASSLPRWFMVGWGVYITTVNLPLYITHGFTRREFARRAPAFIAAASLVLGLMIAVGYALEWIAYRAFDRPQDISASLLYDAPTQFHLLAIEHMLIFAAWIVVGMLVGAGFYRGGLWGVALLPAGAGTVMLVEALTAGPEVGPFGFLWKDVDAPRVPLSLLAYAAAVTVCIALAWTVVRDLPIRARNE